MYYTKHHPVCDGHCGYCEQLKREKQQKEQEDKKLEALFAWDNASTLL